MQTGEGKTLSAVPAVHKHGGARDGHFAGRKSTKRPCAGHGAWWFVCHRYNSP
jgi:hypothetical protein